MAYYDGSIKIDTKLDTSGVKKGAAGLKTALVASGAAIGTAFVAAISQGISFESSFAGVRKTVDATESELAELKQGIRDMAKELPTSANEIAGVAEAAGQLGINKESILDFTETMVKLGDATNLTAEEAATTLARFANITGMSQSNFEKLGSAIVALGNNFATTEAEISAMGMNIASAGTQVGMSEAQILGFATALSSVGMEAQAGGTAISKLMIDMQLATETGGESLTQFANVAGMSAEQFKNAFKEDAAGAITSFISGLRDTDRLGKSAIAVLDDMGITEVRLRDSILRAANAGDLFTDAIETGTKAWEDNTALTKEAEQRYETMESKLGMLKNGLIDLGISVYDGLEEPLKEAVSEGIDSLGELQKSLSSGSLKNALNGVGELFGELVDIVIKVAKFAIPPLVSALGLLGNNLDTVISITGLAVAGVKGFSIMKSVTVWFKGCMTTVNAYTAAIAANAAMETRGITISTLLGSTMKVQEVIVGVLTGKISLLTAAKILATKAQTALNAAWTANPVGLVIAGVAALTAGIVLLVNALKKESQAEIEARKSREESTAALEKQREKAQQLYSQIEQLNDTYTDSVAGAEAEAKATKALTDELFELHSKQDKTIGDKQRMKKIVDDLNGSVEDLNLTFDEEKNTLSLTKDEIYKLIDAKKELAKQNAIQSYLEEGYKVQFKLEFEEQGFIESKIEFEKKLKDAQAELDAIRAEGIETVVANYNGKTYTTLNYTAEQEERMRILRDDIDSYNQKISEYNDLLSENSKQQKDNAESTEFYSEKLTKSYDESAKSALKSSDEIRVAWEMCANNYDSTSSGMLDAANAFYSEMEKDAGAYGSEFMIAWKAAIDSGAFESATSVSDMFDIVEGIIQQRSNSLDFSGILQKGKGPIKAVATEIGNEAVGGIDTIVTEEMPEVGQDAVTGFTDEIYRSGFLVANAGTWLGNQFINANKKSLDVRSPSRRMRDEVAAMVTKGFAIGIKENSWEVTDAVKQMFEDLELQKEVGVITEAEYYDKLRKYRDEYLEESTEEWWDYTKELMKYDEQLVDKQFSDLEWLHESGQISEKRYYEELTRLRNEYFEEGSDEWRDYTLEIQEYSQGIVEAAEEARKAADNAIREGTDKFKDYYNPIIEAEIKNANGDTESFYVLNDFSQAERIEREYNTALEKLKARAGDDPVALSILADMMELDDVQEAIEKINFLLSTTDEQWNNMIAKKSGLEKKTYDDLSGFFGLSEQEEAEKAEATAAAVSGEFISAAEQTREDVTVIADSSWERFKQGFYEKFGTLPDESYNIGVEMMNSLISGALSKLSDFHDQVTSKLLSPLGGTQSSAGTAGGASTDSSTAGGDIYNFYSSKSTVQEQLKAARNQSTLNRMRGAIM